MLGALAVADFRERSRRPAYVVTLAAAIALGYLALPPASSVWVVMNAGGYRGVYNSAYAGTVTALAGGLWLMIGGFYVVRGAITRDEQAGVGQVLAATPLRSAGYLAGKFLSNLMVLGSMAAVLAVTALALQLARGESAAVRPGALLLPFVLLTLPVLAVTAAAAVVFETVPVLRGGLGNVAWFFFWMFATIAGGGAPLGGLGTVAASMRQAMAAQHLPSAAEFSLGFTKLDHPLRTFSWAGLHPWAGFVVARLVLILVATGLAVLPGVLVRPVRPGPRGLAAAGRRLAALRRWGGGAGAAEVSPAGVGQADVGPADVGPAEWVRAGARPGPAGRCRRWPGAGPGSRPGGCWPGRSASWSRASPAGGGSSPPGSPCSASPCPGTWSGPPGPAPRCCCPPPGSGPS